jgi:glutamate racemase
MDDDEDPRGLAESNMIDIFQQPSLSILVTDSGLGGFSVFADAARRLEKDPMFESVTMTYFNAWPEKGHGYNHMADMEERARVFDQALNAMEEFKPDILMIACNTLSAVYPHTKFSKDPRPRVVGIIEVGVDMMFERLSAVPGSRVLILGTAATIESGVHQGALEKKGISSGRITSQPCPRLAAEIENDPAGSRTVDMIEGFAREAALKMKGQKGPLFAALCCTHYGYCRSIFEEMLRKHTGAEVGIVDPNTRMSGTVLEGNGLRKVSGLEIKMKVVTRIKWERSTIESISRLTAGVSPAAAKALAAYEYRSDLFSF